MPVSALRLAAAAALLLACAGTAPAAEKLLIGAGSKASAGALFAQQMCVLIDQQQKRHGIDCETAESPGGAADLQALKAGTLQIAIVRADVLDDAAAGTGAFKDAGPNPDLRALFALGADTLVVLARADANVKSVADLKGKRINLGPPRGEERTLIDLLFKAMGWRLRDMAVTAELKLEDQGDALCRGRLDAVFYFGPQPAPLPRAVAQACDVVVVPVAGREIDALLKDNRALYRAAVPGNAYKGAARETPSIGYAHVAVALARTEARTLYEAARAVFDNVPRLQRADPSLARLDGKRMATEGLVVAPHEGAAKLFRERGWLR